MKVPLLFQAVELVEGLSGVLHFLGEELLSEAVGAYEVMDAGKGLLFEDGGVLLLLSCFKDVRLLWFGLGEEWPPHEDGLHG